MTVLQIRDIIHHIDTGGGADEVFLWKISDKGENPQKFGGF